jgi:hypothetical protein
VKSRAKFRDVEFQRNKRRSAAAGASRPWYLTVDTWIAGTLTTEDAVAANPFGNEVGADICIVSCSASVAGQCQHT